MADIQKHKVVFNIGGAEIPMMVVEEEEHLYVTARQLLQDRLAVLKNKYATKATLNQLMVVLAVETLVDAQKANSNYQRLKNEINNQLDIINTSLSD